MRNLVRSIISRWPGNKPDKDARRVVVFSTHRAASMLLHRVLRDICTTNNIPYYSPNQSKEMQLPFEKIFNGYDFIARHAGCFGPLRFFVPSAALATAKIILHLRDPRDVLTSMFFSYCFMHPGEIEPNTGYRKEVAEAGIDQFVLDMSGDNFSRYRGSYGTGLRHAKYAGNVLDRYQTYLKEIAGKPNVILLSYEEMVLDFGSWLRKFLSAFDLSNPEQTYQIVSEKRGPSVQPGSEDASKHKRKVTPGDHKEKLKPETVAELNRRFGNVLAALGYSQHAAEQVPSA